MRMLFLVGVAVLATSCVAAPHPDMNKSLAIHMDGPMDELTACSVRFLRKYAGLRGGAGTLKVAYDIFCASEEGKVRLAGYEVERAQGGYNITRARYYGEQMVDALRSRTIGIILLKRSGG